ncbi:unnamed protein product [Gadus morhua 'NCC']
MKNAVSQQSTACENLCGITTDINQRLSVIEQPSSSKGNAATIVACEGAQLHGPSYRKPAPGPSALAVAEETAGGGSAATMSPAWSHVLKHGKHKQRPGKQSTAAVQSKTSVNPPREKKTYGIVGTGAVGNIHAVTTKLVVIRWLETYEEAKDPDLVAECELSVLKAGQTAPDQGQTAPDRDQTAPDRGQTAPDRGQTAPDRDQTAPDRDQTAPDRGQTTPDQGQTPDEPADRALRKDLSQVTGNTRTWLRGLRKLWAETLTIAQLDQEEKKPLGRPSGLNPFPGQTAPDHGQTAPDRGQTAPDHGQTPDEPADRALRKDLSQVTGNTRIRLRGLRKLWAETRTIALPDQKEKKPLGRSSGLNPLGHIKTATQQAEGKGLRPWMHAL